MTFILFLLPSNFLSLPLEAADNDVTFSELRTFENRSIASVQEEEYIVISLPSFLHQSDLQIEEEEKSRLFSSRTAMWLHSVKIFMVDFNFRHGIIMVGIQYNIENTCRTF